MRRMPLVMYLGILQLRVTLASGSPQCSMRWQVFLMRDLYSSISSYIMQHSCTARLTVESYRYRQSVMCLTLSMPASSNQQYTSNLSPAWSQKCGYATPVLLSQMYSTNWLILISFISRQRKVRRCDENHTFSFTRYSLLDTTGFSLKSRKQLPFEQSFITNREQTYHTSGSLQTQFSTLSVWDPIRLSSASTCTTISPSLQYFLTQKNMLPMVPTLCRLCTNLIRLLTHSLRSDRQSSTVQGEPSGDMSSMYTMWKLLQFWRIMDWKNSLYLFLVLILYPEAQMQMGFSSLVCPMPYLQSQYMYSACLTFGSSGNLDSSTPRQNYWLAVLLARSSTYCFSAPERYLSRLSLSGKSFSSSNFLSFSSFSLQLKVMSSQARSLVILSSSWVKLTMLEMLEKSYQESTWMRSYMPSSVRLMPSLTVGTTPSCTLQSQPSTLPSLCLLNSCLVMTSRKVLATGCSFRRVGVGSTNLISVIKGSGRARIPPSINTTMARRIRHVAGTNKRVSFCLFSDRALGHYYDTQSQADFSGIFSSLAARTRIRQCLIGQQITTSLQQTLCFMVLDSGQRAFLQYF